MHTNTIGGSRETEENALTVNPNGWPCSAYVVTTVTVAATLPMVDKNTDGSIIGTPCSEEILPRASKCVSTATSAIDCLGSNEGTRLMAEFFYTKGGERHGPTTRASLQDLIDRGDVSSGDFFWIAGMDEWKTIGHGALPHGSAEMGAAPTVQEASPTSYLTEQAADSNVPIVTESPSVSAPANAVTAPSVSAPANTVSAPSPMQSTFGSASVTSSASGDQVGVKDIAIKMPKPIWFIVPALFFILGGVLYGITIIGLIVAWVPIWLGVLLFQANKALESARATGYRNDLMTAVEKIELYFRIIGIMYILSFVLMVLSFIFVFAIGGSLGEFGNL